MSSARRRTAKRRFLFSSASRRMSWLLDIRMPKLDG